MAGTYKFTAPQQQNGPRSEGSKNKVSKNRIYADPTHKSTIQLDELSLAAEKDTRNEKIEVNASLIYPLIKINDYMLSKDEINILEIDCNDTIPTIMLKCTFIKQTFISKEMPKDGDIISVAIRNKSDVLKQLRNDYVITSVVSGVNTTNKHNVNVLTFFGILFIPGISSSKLNHSYEGTSFEAIKDVSKKMGLGFATNESNTEDKQVWISGYNTVLKYMNTIVERSWSNNESFYDMWIDVYYNLNFINVNKVLLSNEDEVDLGVLINNIDKDYTYGDDTDQNKARESPKVLSNFDSYRTSSYYIYTWRPQNRSTKITHEIGTKINCHLFEHNEQLFQDESTKYWKIGLEPFYDPAKVNKYILLRGRATQQPGMAGDDLAKANYSYPDMYINNTWLGIQYTASNTNEDNLQWDGNHHKNYLRAKVQNLINAKELEKLNVEVSVNGLNMNIIKGDKIPVVLIQKDEIEAALVQDSDGMQRLEQFYSGWYYVKGFKIRYNHINDDSTMSNFTQTFTLTRKEWPPPIAVDAIKNNENNI